MLSKFRARLGMIHPRFDSKRHAIFSVARHSYAWPGGYLLVLVMSDGQLLCPKCVKENVAAIVRATRDPDFRTGWEMSGVGNLAEMESEGETCAHCYKELSTL